MKKICLAILLVVLITVSCVFAGCSSKNAFGEFGQKGRYLKSMAKKDISFSTARKKVKSNALYASSSDNDGVMVVEIDDIPEISGKLVDAIRSKYSGVKITAKYYNEKNKRVKGDIGSETQSERFFEYLSDNCVDTSIGLRVNNLIMFEELLNYMEKANKDFKADPNSINYPFKSLYSCHTDRKGRLVIQMRSFAEISGVGINGGIASYFRQDTEARYDSENKLIKWQTSFGIKVSTMSGTKREGYIYEVEFEWIEKK